MSSISDVAKLAGVSSATVSRVINNPEVVSPETRKIVEQAIEELNFHPNYLGKRLRTSTSNLIMVLVRTVNNPYYNVVIDAIQNEAREKGYDVMLCQDHASPEIAASYIRHLKHKLVDGLIVLDNTIDNSILGDLDHTTFPVVQCSQYCENEPISFVSVDDRAAMVRLVKYLISTGRKRIALINGDSRFIYAKHRLDGYHQALAETELRYDPALVKHVDTFNPETAIQCSNQLIQLAEPPDAIVCAADLIAIAAMKAANRRGLKVPQDIAIASFDNTDYCMLTEPAITSVSQPRYQLGALAFKVLLDRMNDIKAPIQQIMLENEIIIRSST